MPIFEIFKTATQFFHFFAQYRSYMTQKNADGHQIFSGDVTLGKLPFDALYLDGYICTVSKGIFNFS